MHALALTAAGRQVTQILAVGAHADDIEIGCGGTVLSLLAARPGIEVWWVVLSATEGRDTEARSGADSFLSAASAHVEVHAFRDGFLPYEAAEVKEVFEDLKARVRPDLVLTHCQDDAHQDHRLVADLTWNTFRDHLILEYEISKWDGDIGRPNVYVPLSRKVVERKVSLLESNFTSQAGKDWFERETFTSLMRLRGMECRAPDRYAEAFVARKLAVDL